MDGITKKDIYEEALRNYRYKISAELKNSIINIVEAQISHVPDPLPGVTILKRLMEKEVDRLYNINLLIDELSTKDDL